MEIPERVEVLGISYGVRVGGRVSPSEELYGMVDNRAQEIVLDGSLARDKLEQTYLHELVHAILHQLACQEACDDERLVQGIALGLHGAL